MTLVDMVLEFLVFLGKEDERSPVLKSLKWIDPRSMMKVANSNCSIILYIWLIVFFHLLNAVEENEQLVLAEKRFDCGPGQTPVVENSQVSQVRAILLFYFRLCEVLSYFS